MVPTLEHSITFDKAFEGIANHVKQHKVAYSLGAGIAIAGITCLIMRSSIAQRGMCEGINAQRGFANTASFSLNFRNKQVIRVTTVLEREGRGHPGWPVLNKETNEVFLSQRATAKAFDISEGILSLHLKGELPDAGGYHFERVSLPIA